MSLPLRLMQLEQGFKPKPFRPVPGKGSKAKEKAKEANKKLPTILPQHKNKRSSRVSSSSTPTNSNEKLRELSSTPFLSWYWFVWRQASWEVFLDGSKYRSFDKAKREQNFKDLEKRPGVYEFCIALPGSRKHFKVCVTIVFPSRLLLITDGRVLLHLGVCWIQQ